MDWTLELVVVPVSDVDRAKAFYIEQPGFKLLVDTGAGPDFRVVQPHRRRPHRRDHDARAGAVPAVRPAGDTRGLIDV